MQEQLQNATSLPSHTSWLDPLMIPLCLLVFVSIGIVVRRLKAKPTQQWLLMATSFALVGVAGTLWYQAVNDQRLAEYREATADQEILIAQMQAELVSQYDILDATPVREYENSDGETEHRVVSDSSKQTLQEAWFRDVLTADAFYPALVSVILPESHETAIYMVEFDNDAETFVMHNTLKAAAAPPVEEIVR